MSLIFAFLLGLLSGLKAFTAALRGRQVTPGAHRSAPGSSGRNRAEAPLCPTPLPPPPQAAVCTLVR